MVKRFAPLVAAAALAAWPFAASAQAVERYYGPHMWNGEWYGWIIGPLMMVVFLAVGVLVVVLLVRWLSGPPGHGHVLAPPPAGNRALDILRERFARGEIDKAEYEERRRLLHD